MDHENRHDFSVNRLQDLLSVEEIVFISYQKNRKILLCLESSVLALHMKIHLTL